MKYRHSGKEKRLALGVYPTVSLKTARDLAGEARKVMQAGGDPGELRKADKAKAQYEAENTLQAVADDWLAHQSARWGKEQKDRTRASLVADIFPVTAQSRNVPF